MLDVALLMDVLHAHRLHNAVYPEEPVFSLTLLHVLSAPLHGLANAFVFSKDTWSQLSNTGIKVRNVTRTRTTTFVTLFLIVRNMFQLALQSRLCDSTRIGEYHPANVRYTVALESESDDDDNNVLFYSPDMSLKDRGP